MKLRRENRIFGWFIKKMVKKAIFWALETLFGAHPVMGPVVKVAAVVL